MMVKLIRRSLGALAVLAACASVGSASTIYLPAQVFNFGPIGPLGTAAATFNKFDQSAYSTATQLAVLTSVEIDLTTTSNGSILVVNAGLAAAAFQDAFTQLPVAVSAAGISYNVLAKVNKCGSFTTPNPGPCTNTANGVGGTALPFGTPGLDTFGSIPTAANTISNGTGTASAQGFVNPTKYSVYEFFGSSPIPVTVNISAGLASSGGAGDGAFLFGGTATTAGVLSITYGYDMVNIPEPMTMGLMGSALIGLAVLVRRKRRA